MLEAGGKPARLGLGKPRAFLVVGCLRLGGRYPASQINSLSNSKLTEDPTTDGGSTGVKTPEEEFSGSQKHHRNPTLPGFGFRILGTRWTIQLFDI